MPYCTVWVLLYFNQLKILFLVVIQKKLRNKPSGTDQYIKGISLNDDKYIACLHPHFHLLPTPVYRKLYYKVESIIAVLDFACELMGVFIL